MRPLPLLFLAALSGCTPTPSETAAPSEGPARSEATQPAPNPTPDNAAPAPAVNPRQSHYTRLDTASCRTLAQNQDEAGYWLGRCPGHAGWSLEWSEGDLRHELILIAPDGKRTELNLIRHVAQGAFNSLGPTIEWRGKGSAPPDAMIVRMNVAVPTEPRRPDISRLAVVRLAPAPCVTAVIEPGPAQNEQAREAADSPGQRCLDR